MDDLNIVTVDARTQQNPKVVFILTQPRSLSTILSRILMEYENCKIFVDELSSIWSVKMIDRNEKILLELAKGFEDAVDNQISQGKTVIMKEMSGLFINHMYALEYYRKKWNCEFLFLVRHPALQLKSFKTMVDIEKIKTPDLGNWLEERMKLEMYKNVLILYETYPGYVLMVEELQRYPSETLQSVYDFLNWKWDDKYLTFNPLTIDFLTDTQKPFYSWYENCITSTEFKASVPKTDVKFEEDWLNEILKSSLVYYEEIKSMTKNNIKYPYKKN